MSEDVISSVEINFVSDSCCLVDSNGLLTETTRQDDLGVACKAKRKNTDQQNAITSLSPNPVDAEQARYYIDHFEGVSLQSSHSQQTNSIRRLDSGRYQGHYLYAAFEIVEALAVSRETAVIPSVKIPESLHSESSSAKANDLRALFLLHVLPAIPMTHNLRKDEQNYGIRMHG